VKLSIAKKRRVKIIKDDYHENAGKFLLLCKKNPFSIKDIFVIRTIQI